MNINEMKLNLIKWSDSYYNKGVSIVSDSTFDKIYSELKLLCPNDPILRTIGSPIPESSPWEKAKHNIPMGSLNKVNTVEELFNWIEKSGISYSICSEKLDGISIEIEYENGKFSRAITRGDGIIGEDITSNVKNMKNVLMEVNNSWTGSIRGEIIIMEDDFNFVNNILEIRGDKPLKNMRNGTSGIAKRLDGTFSEYLTVLFYDITGIFKFESQKLEFIETLGFKTVWWKYCLDKYDVENIYDNYNNDKRITLHHEIDGLVICAEDISIQNALGKKDGCPKYAIAWKFPSMKVKAEIIDVIWQLGMTGKLTPVAIFKPIRIGGVTVQRATLHNYTRFTELNLHKHDILLIERANDVIPAVIKNLSTNSNKEDKFIVPSICPECLENLKITEEGVEQLFCINPLCSGKEFSNLKKWVNVIFKDSKGLGGETIQKFYNWKLIKTPDDFYKLKRGDIKGLPGFGKRKETIILNIINENKEVTLDKFIGGLNIPNFGQRMTKKLIQFNVNSIEKIKDVNITKLCEIDGIEIKTATNFKNNFKQLENLISNLFKVGIKIIEEKEPEVITTENKLNSKSFCFTGAIKKEKNGKRLNRKDMQKLTIENGGIVFDKVKKGLDYLVQADPNSVSNKTINANKFGTIILSEDNFFELIR